MGKSETTDTWKTQEKYGEFELGLAFGKINSKGSVEFSFCNATPTQTDASEIIFNLFQ